MMVAGAGCWNALIRGIRRWLKGSSPADGRKAATAVRKRSDGVQPRSEAISTRRSYLRRSRRTVQCLLGVVKTRPPSREAGGVSETVAAYSLFPPGGQESRAATVGCVLP